MILSAIVLLAFLTFLSGTHRSIAGNGSIPLKAGQSSLWSGNDSSVGEKRAVIKSWFTECASHHPECAPPIHQYPRRLVEVGTEGTNLRLVDTNNFVPDTARYATLSYCWGTVRPLTTTSDNVDLFATRIPAEDLPRTFLEAVSITRDLGIPYLWIDSLCIVQDDPGDWRMEAGRMKDIYSGSSITISASDAQNSTPGLFRRQPSENFGGPRNPGYSTVICHRRRRHSPSRPCSRGRYIASCPDVSPQHQRLELAGATTLLSRGALYATRSALEMFPQLFY